MENRVGEVQGMQESSNWTERWLYMVSYLVLAILFLAIFGCEELTEINSSTQEAQWEYPLIDGRDAKTRSKILSDDLAGSRFELIFGDKRQSYQDWNTVLSFIHLSDIQIRESKIGMDDFVSQTAEWMGISGSIRHTDLDQNDEYAFLAMVGAINTEIRERKSNQPSFVMHTGDAIDVGTQGEFLQFVAVANLFDLPWFNVLGNHDVFYFGNFTQKNLNADRFLTGLQLINSKSNFAENHSYESISKFPGGLNENAYFKDTETEVSSAGIPGSYCHGFDLDPCSSKQASRAACSNPYYSFVVETNHPHVRIVVLDTIADDPEVELDILQVVKRKIGAFPGTISENQFNWLQKEIRNAASADQVVLIFGHHPLESESEGPVRYNAATLTQSKTKPRLVDFLRSKPNVLAYFGGHTHKAAIRCWPRDSGAYSACEESPKGTPAFLEVIAPSVHEWPQEGFLIRLLQEENTNNLALAVRPIAPVVNGGSAAHRWKKARYGAYCDTQKNAEICKDKNRQLDSIAPPTPGVEIVALTALNARTISRRHTQECSIGHKTLPEVSAEMFGDMNQGTAIYCSNIYENLTYALDGKPLYLADDQITTHRQKIDDFVGVYFQGAERFLKLQSYTLPKNAKKLRALSQDQEKIVSSWVFVEEEGGFRQIISERPKAGFSLEGVRAGSHVYIVAVYQGDGCCRGLIDIWVEVDELAGSIDMEIIHGNLGKKPEARKVYEFNGDSIETLYEIEMTSTARMEDPLQETKDRFEVLMNSFPAGKEVRRTRDWSWDQALDLWHELQQSRPDGWLGRSITDAQTDLIIFNKCQPTREITSGIQASQRETEAIR
jgi:3',5'-cyclic AMP phosphodiesterase CpdA